MNKLKNGFTLIELLVVISIIAILSTLIVVYLNTAKMNARDARRLSDVKQIQLALKMFYNDVGIYPTLITAGSSIANGGTNYLLRVPANPAPRNDNGCPDQEYQYKQLESGARYSLGFCLGDKTDDIDGGMRVATANGILNCPTGYVAVPGSSTFNTNDFCVMEYEAKCALTSAPTAGLTTNPTGETTYDDTTYPCTSANSKQVVSVSSGYPIANINQATAIARCQALGGHLVTNLEWMTIARNIEAQASNWSGGSVGSGYVFAGNYNTTDAMDGTALYGAAASGSDTHYYRLLTLTSTDTINDFSGNVAEILDTTCTLGTGTGNYEDAASFTEWTSVSAPDLSDYEKGASGPSGAYSSTNYIGKYKGCDVTSNIFLRGGKANTATADTGIFNIDLSDAAPSSTLYGFRCVK